MNLSVCCSYFHNYSSLWPFVTGGYLKIYFLKNSKYLSVTKIPATNKIKTSKNKQKHCLSSVIFQKRNSCLEHFYLGCITLMRQIHLNVTMLPLTWAIRCLESTCVSALFRLNYPAYCKNAASLGNFMS